MIFSDETTIPLNCVTGLVWNLTRKRKVVWNCRASNQSNVWHCFSSKGFGPIICLKQNLNAELMCDIYKRGLLLMARKQFGHDSSAWKLQEDHDPKHTPKLAVNWKRNNEAF